VREEALERSTSSETTDPDDDNIYKVLDEVGGGSLLDASIGCSDWLEVDVGVDADAAVAVAGPAVGRCGRSHLEVALAGTVHYIETTIVVYWQRRWFATVKGEGTGMGLTDQHATSSNQRSAREAVYIAPAELEVLGPSWVPEAQGKHLHCASLHHLWR
jgi:hypothetical protein